MPCYDARDAYRVNLPWEIVSFEHSLPKDPIDWHTEGKHVIAAFRTKEEAEAANAILYRTCVIRHCPC